MVVPQKIKLELPWDPAILLLGIYYFLNFFFFFNFTYLFLEREDRKEQERERNTNVGLPLMRPPTGDLAHNPGIFPDWESNWQPFGSQVGTQSTEPHQPGLSIYFFKKWKH